MTLTPALRLIEVRKSFARIAALAGVDLELRSGEVVSLIGPSGCGKTTALRLVAGLDTPDQGTIEIGGLDAAAIPAHRRGVGFVFQDYALFPHLTVRRNVSFGVRSFPRSEREDRVTQALRLVGLEDSAQRMPAELSGGQQQRVALARALAPRPSVLLLDEPLSNLDPQLRRQVRHELLSIIHSLGIATLWVTHDHDEGFIAGDRVAVMNQGVIRQTGKPREIWRAPADAWVAKFIGRGELVDGVAREGLLVTALGEVLAPQLPDGSNGKALVGADDLAITELGAPGRVVRRHFDGAGNVYCIQLDQCGTLLHCRQPDGVDIPRGTEVCVTLATSELPVFS